MRPAHLHIRLLALAFVGGAVGTAARVGLGLALGTFGAALWPSPDASSVLIANVTGSLILGFALQALALLGPDTGRRRAVRILLGTGFCGGYTTYSTLAVTSLNLFASGSWWLGAVYTIATVAAGLLAAWVGIRLATTLLRRRRAAHSAAATADPANGEAVDGHR